MLSLCKAPSAYALCTNLTDLCNSQKKIPTFVLMKNLILILFCTGLVSSLSGQKFHVGVKTTDFMKVETMDGSIEINDSLFIITIKGENNKNKVKKYNVCKRDSNTVYIPLISDTVVVLINPNASGEKRGYTYDTTISWWVESGITQYFCRKEE